MSVWFNHCSAVLLSQQAQAVLNFILWKTLKPERSMSSSNVLEVSLIQHGKTLDWESKNGFPGARRNT